MATRRRRSAGAEEPADKSTDPPADPAAVARTICLRALTMSPKTRSQLADLLSDRGVPDDIAHEVLERFSDVGLIDDAAFANAWVHSRHNGKGLARRALADELRKRGVDDEVARDAIETIDGDVEAATARSLVIRKLPSMTGLPPEARTRRLVGMLARKGYGPGLAFRVVREAIEEAGHHLDDAFNDDAAAAAYAGD